MMKRYDSFVQIVGFNSKTQSVWVSINFVFQGGVISDKSRTKNGLSGHVKKMRLILHFLLLRLHFLCLIIYLKL